MLDLTMASLPEIASHYESLKPNWVRANMIISQDGHFVGPSDSSRDLTNESDLKLLLLLRALSDVVLVGATTARIEQYRQPKARPEFAFLDRTPPRLAIVSASLDFNLAAPMFAGGKEKSIILNVGTNRASEELMEIADVINLDLGDDSPVEFATKVTQALADLGLSKITCEGGPSLLAQLLRAKAVDEYDLTISPVTIGGIPQWPDTVPELLDWNEVGLAVSGDFVFKRLLLVR